MLNPEKVQMIHEKIKYTIFGKCYSRENYYFFVLLNVLIFEK